MTNVDALQFAMPSVTVNNFGQGNDFNIRGIGKAEHNTQTTTGVITYRDGVPTFPGYFQEEPYYDVANIQVLRGPQGTFVGQNATGGAVFVNTNDPIIGGGMHGYVNANYGNYNDVGAAGRGQHADQRHASRRASRFYGERRDSFYNITGPGGAPYTGNKGKMGHVAGRVSLLWKPSEQFLGAVEDRPRLSRYRRLSGVALLSAQAAATRPIAQRPVQHQRQRAAGARATSSSARC